MTLSLKKSGFPASPSGTWPDLCQQLGANGKQISRQRLGAGRELLGCAHPAPTPLPGYTVSSVISTKHERIYVAGAPRFNHTGKVIIFSMHNNRNLTIHQALKGEQVTLGMLHGFFRLRGCSSIDPSPSSLQTVTFTRLRSVTCSWEAGDGARNVPVVPVGESGGGPARQEHRSHPLLCLLQIGSYYGSEINSLDVNGDGITDVLLVGAPMYFSEGRERGKVYVYTLREVHGSTTGRAGGPARAGAFGG